MQSNFPKTPLLFFTAFFCISLLAFFFLYWTVNTNNRELQTKEEKWQNETLRRDGIRALDRSIEMIEGERAQLETHFAKSSDVVPFLDTIEGLAKKVNAKAEVTSVSILADDVGLMVGMKASGTFYSLYKFLMLLENSPYELEFIGMDIDRKTIPDTKSKNIQVSEWEAIFKIRLLSFIK
ncbi:MAG: hypothetical protein WC735_03350 [Candidatus Paceibacterota bacterium]|jgi:hypothetical protein